jgi:hypothetical protein
VQEWSVWRRNRRTWRRMRVGRIRLGWVDGVEGGAWGDGEEGGAWGDGEEGGAWGDGEEGLGNFLRCMTSR